MSFYNMPETLTYYHPDTSAWEEVPYDEYYTRRKKNLDKAKEICRMIILTLEKEREYINDPRRSDMIPQHKKQRVERELVLWKAKRKEVYNNPNIMTFMCPPEGSIYRLYG